MPSANTGIYFDSGILVKLYVGESNSQVADAMVLGLSDSIPLTHLLELEIRNALRLKCARGELTLAGMNSALADFQSDIDIGRYHRPAYRLENIFRRAEVLSRHHAVRSKCRSLDVLHVAAALEIQCQEFASFDERQRTVAGEAGLIILPR